MVNGTVKVTTGRMKEAAGVLVGNDKLRSRGAADQVIGRVQQGTETAVRRAKASGRRTAKKLKGR